MVFVAGRGEWETVRGVMFMCLVRLCDIDTVVCVCVCVTCSVCSVSSYLVEGGVGLCLVRPNGGMGEGWRPLCVCVCVSLYISMCICLCECVSLSISMCPCVYAQCHECVLSSFMAMY